MVRTTRRRVPGSGLLEALELASQTANTGRVVLFTDAETFEPESIRLRTSTPVKIKGTIKRWAQRLRGLRGVQLMMVGVGYGVHNTPSVRNAARLFRGLARRVRASSFSWSQNLPVDFASSMPE